MSDETSIRPSSTDHQASDTAANGPTDGHTDAFVDDTMLDEARDVLNDARRRLAEAPAEIVITNHVMGLYELAAIHLGAEPPDLPQAALAIDAVACLVEGLGERLGPEADTLAVALSNIRLAFVQIKGAHAG